MLEIVNKEAIRSGLGGGLHGPANKMLNGINMLRSTNVQGPLSFLKSAAQAKPDPKESEMRQFSKNYKAELVRHNIVTRTDLMKLYHPPLKKS